MSFRNTGNVPLYARSMPRFILEEKVMRERPIIVTELDAAKLRGLVGVLAHAQRDQDHLKELALELERARVVGRDEVPRDVVTMHARVQVSDLMTGKRRELVLVFPGQA